MKYINILLLLLSFAWIAIVIVQQFYWAENGNYNAGSFVYAIIEIIIPYAIYYFLNKD